MVKRPSQQAANSRSEVTAEQAELLAKRLADKPYGSTENALQEPEKQSRTTISLNESMLVQLEDMALKNKREGREPKSVSAIVRDALDAYLSK
ncbi:CopG family transcriptional regulator [Providencia rettgeri]|uniref:CopG family transcriptional regulator n=1 Tax=Providencia rettgeri TaxID=587 RepID=UPI0019D4C576|nr:CopG family transcriptional regulator [Providencia rettgeri]MBN7843621.1 CopG family transcriptional regulator [Providencia rettgeri]MBN7855309.1 CopG family transcriptional regulator [Providencia rettgeri]MBN7864752.1 CopG family transcriptional regulator [Providencia rettgeri]MBN7872543.1 CopG family transcriptional regulator [Providencia rettgeri]MBN7897544.1 CopG family transcriptional regulator [Providencia rettgeri]